MFTMSVPRSMQRMVTVPRGRGTLARMKSRKGEISGMLLVRVYAMDFFRLSKMRRPAETGRCELQRWFLQITKVTELQTREMLASSEVNKNKLLAGSDVSMQAVS